MLCNSSRSSTPRLELQSRLTPRSVLKLQFMAPSFLHSIDRHLPYALVADQDIDVLAFFRLLAIVLSCRVSSGGSVPYRHFADCCSGIVPSSDKYEHIWTIEFCLDPLLLLSVPLLMVAILHCVILKPNQSGLLCERGEVLGTSSRRL